VKPQFSPTSLIWRDGRLIAWDDAVLHVMSHVVHYGSSIFEGIRCYDTPDGPALFRLREHMKRFIESCRIYRLPLPYDIETLSAACIAVIDANGIPHGYVRPLAVRGYGAAGVNPAGSPVDTYVICWPWGTYLGEGALDSGIDVCVSTWRRAAPDTFPMLAKAGGHYLAAQLMKMEAIANGFVEGIALNTDGLVSEGSGENIFLVRNGVLITPSIDGSQLPGLTRDAVLTIARDFGIPCQEQAVPRELLYVSDEVFLTGTAAEITPVRSIDRIQVGEGSAGPITRRIQERFLGITHGRLEDRYGWLTHVKKHASVIAR